MRPDLQKKIIMKNCILIFGLWLSVHICNGQDSLNKTIHFKDSTVEYDVSIKIKKGTREVDFLVFGFLENGELSFKISDPEGKPEGGFELYAVGEDGHVSPGRGKMTHTVKVPYPGTWTVHIKASKATGNLAYKLNIKAQ